MRISLTGLSFIVFLLLQSAVEKGVAQSVIVKKELQEYGMVEYVEGEVIIQFHDHVTNEEQASFKQQAKGNPRSAGRGTLHYQSEENEQVEELMDYYRDHPDVQHVQPNFIYRLIHPVEGSSEWEPSTHRESGPVMPNDTFFDSQWALQNKGQAIARDQFGNTIHGLEGSDISASLAWNITTGSDDVIIAVFDTGIDYTHPDLAENMFRDSEGRYGVDCSPGNISEEGECSDDPMDYHKHGTHVAGTIGATGDNGVGISGISWNVRLMAVKIFNDDNETSTASILAGYDYAIENGAVISNHSYGTSGGMDGFDQLHKDRILEAGLSGHLSIIAAGNNDGDNDINPVYPASYKLDNIISVGASTIMDVLADFSNFGSMSVNIAAPGTMIYSTVPGGYEFLEGTSMAAPHVTGVAGLILASFPEVTYQEIRSRLLENGDVLSSLDGKILGARRLNAFRALPTADLQIIHASPGLRADDVNVLINGEVIAHNLLFSEISSELKIPADTDIVLSVVSNHPETDSGWFCLML